MNLSLREEHKEHFPTKLAISVLMKFIERREQKRPARQVAIMRYRPSGSVRGIAGSSGIVIIVGKREERDLVPNVSLLTIETILQDSPALHFRTLRS